MTLSTTTVSPRCCTTFVLARQLVCGSLSSRNSALQQRMRVRTCRHSATSWTFTRWMKLWRRQSLKIKLWSSMTSWLQGSLVLARHFPGVLTVGLFIARRAPDADDSWDLQLAFDDED